MELVHEREFYRASRARLRAPGPEPEDEVCLCAGRGEAARRRRSMVHAVHTISITNQTVTHQHPSGSADT